MTSEADSEPRFELDPRAVAEDFFERMADGGQVVSIGTLSGVDSDGEEFDGVRYVDVHEVRDGLIHRLDIWNDLAVEGVVDPGSGS